MRKAAIILFVLLWALSSEAQSLRDTVKLISDIKRDSLYVYGDATTSSEAEARKQAERALLSGIPEAQKIDTSRVFYLFHQRGNMIRAFAYIARADLLSDGQENNSGFDEQLHQLEEILRAARDVPELETYLLERGNEKIKMGIVSVETPAKDLEESFILICQGSRIRAAFSPVGSGHQRCLLQTGETMNRITHKKGEIIRWVHIDTF